MNFADICVSPLPVFHGRRAPRAFYRAILFLALLACTACVPSQSGARSVHASQSDVEAAYLYNFGKFVRWPASASSHGLNICILGHDPFGTTLDRIVAGEQIDGHRIAVTRLPDTRGIQSCSIVFIDSSEAPRLADAMSTLSALPIMTVSDMADFLDRGGMIQFVVKDDRVRFEVNLEAADKRGLALSSQLLKVAVAVVGSHAEKAAR